MTTNDIEKLAKELERLAWIVGMRFVLDPVKVANIKCNR